MEHEKSYDLRESKSEISIEPPVTESFLNPARAAEIWPENITTNENFLEQIETRQELNKNLNDVINCLPRPDIPLDTAIEQGHISEEQAIKMYQSLSGLLEASEDYRRIALYLPFEFLPKKAWRPSSETLQQAIDRFRQAYMQSWYELLKIHSIRASFVDGDVPEAEQRVDDVPRVVKAAHLIPKLVENGLMEVKDAIALIEENDDQTLKHSVADALPVLADLGLLTEKEIKYMEESKDWLVNNMARIIVANIKAKEQQPESTLKTITLSSVQEELDEKFSRIDTKDYGDITKKRKIWLKQKKKQEAIEVLADDISTTIIKNRLKNETRADFLAPEANTASQQALIEGIRKAIESAALANPEKAQALYTQYKGVLLTLWGNNTPETKEALSKTFRRLHHLSLVNDSQLAELNIAIPKLAGPFSENLELIQKEMGEIKGMVAAIESNPALSKLIYPVALVYGSRLKGYGEASADIDLAVFVKPETSFDSHGGLQELLKDAFGQDEIGEIVEFWLEEKGGNLNVRDFADSGKSVGESYWTYVLFGAAWEGNKEVIRELREKLLAPYMSDTKKELYGHDARTIYLEELERDTLQYRLMHKGYERFFPTYGGIHTAHSDEIDGESMFWDSGYRQLATKLFASRVFLPKIPAP